MSRWRGRRAEGQGGPAPAASGQVLSRAAVRGCLVWDCCKGRSHKTHTCYMRNECNTRPASALPRTSPPLTTSAAPWPSGWTRAGPHITEATAATPSPPTQTVCGHHGNGHTHWIQPPPPLTFYNLYQYTSSTQSKDAKDPLRKKKRKPGHRRGTPAPPSPLLPALPSQWPPAPMGGQKPPPSRVRHPVCLGTTAGVAKTRGSGSTSKPAPIPEKPRGLGQADPTTKPAPSSRSCRKLAAPGPRNHGHAAVASISGSSKPLRFLADPN